MEIEEQKFLDAGEQDEQSQYEYYYSGMNYLIKEGSRGISARIYDDTPDRCSFVSRIENERVLPFGSKIPYDDSFFCRAVVHMLDRQNVKAIDLLISDRNSGYQPINLDSVRLTLQSQEP